MTDVSSFAKMVPGFDFLQGLVKNAGSALPNMGQWVAPTLNPEELEKRIQELKTVQFWLEQNARMLGATIQALEVQRMTLSTLKSMNVSMQDLRESMTLKMPKVAEAPAPAPAAAPAPAEAEEDAAPATPPGVVDPMQWWGALTQQFTQLATNAMKDGATDMARNLAGDMVKQSLDVAGETLKKAVAMPAAVAQKAASAATAAATAAASTAANLASAVVPAAPAPATARKSTRTAKPAQAAAAAKPAAKAARKTATRAKKAD